MLECSDQAKGAELENYCNCSKTVGAIGFEKTSNDQIKRAHDIYVADKYQNKLEVALDSISDDLSNIQLYDVTAVSKSKLFTSCNIQQNLSNKLEKCASNKKSNIFKLNSFSKINGLERPMDRFLKNFKNDLKSRQDDYQNYDTPDGRNSCIPFDKNNSTGFVKRCAPEYKSSCNMSDNLSRRVFKDHSTNMFIELLTLFNDHSDTELNTEKSLLYQMSDLDFMWSNQTKDKDLQKKYYKIKKTLEKDPFYKDLLRSKGKKEELENYISEIKPDDISQTKARGFSELKTKLQEKMSSLEEAKVIQKCKKVYEDALTFFCQEREGNESEKFNSSPKSDFINDIRNYTHNEEGSDTLKNAYRKLGFQATQAYCILKDKKKSIESPFKLLESQMTDNQKKYATAKEAASDTFEKQSQHVRGTEKKPMLCKEIYGPIYNKAKGKGLNISKNSSPQEKVNLYTFQLEEYGKKLSSCSHEQLCDYLKSLISITELEMSRATSQLLDEKEVEIQFKKEGKIFVSKDYSKLAGPMSLAQSVLLGDNAIEENKNLEKHESAITEKSKNSMTNKTIKSTESSTIQSSASNLSQAENNSAYSKPDRLQKSSVVSYSVLKLSPETVSKFEKQNDKDYQDLREKIQESKARLRELSFVDPEAYKREKNAFKAEYARQVTEQKSVSLNEQDFSELNKYFDDQKNQDEGRSPASTKIAPPSTFELRELQNQVLNQTVNSKYLSSDDRIELDSYMPGDSNLINKYGLTDQGGNVMPLMEVTIKGSIEEEFTKVLEKDDLKSLTKDRKMILSDPSQDKHFKTLAKALVQKKTFLISRHDNKDIKLIVRYNPKIDDYTVEPFAGKNRLLSYKADYDKFQKNIYNAIRDKTFQTLMNRYKRD